jgi:hypothetical protein
MGLIQIFLGGSTMDYAQSFIFRSRPGEMLLNNRDCQTTRGTEKFLEKSIQDLMRCGLVKSKRGGLRRIEAIEGPIAVKRTNRNGGRP